MATPLVTKIVLKNTTKMSLNERFTAYREQASTATSTYRNKIHMQRQATSANLRLAQSMANRPTVIAALKLKKRSLQQRLGGAATARQHLANHTNVKSRLNLRGKRVEAGSNIQGRLGNFRGRGGARGRGAFKPGTSPLIKARLGGNPRPVFNNQRRPGQNFRNNRRGNFQVGNRQNQNRGNPGGSGLPASRNARGGRSNRGGGRGRGGRWGGGAVPATAAVPTKQELDNQLDEYMAETKGSLDVGLYM